jgi:hypothetical protein
LTAASSGGSPEAFRAFAVSEVKRWTQVIKAARIEEN